MQKFRDLGTLLELSTKCWQNVHYRFVADFSKIMCWFPTFDGLCCWVACQHCVVHIDMWLSDIAIYFSKYFFYFIMLFSQQQQQQQHQKQQRQHNITTLQSDPITSLKAPRSTHTLLCRPLPYYHQPPLCSDQNSWRHSKCEEYC